MLMPSHDEVVDPESAMVAPVEEIRVLIVDPSIETQSRLLQIFSENPWIHVVGLACTGSEALVKADTMSPHVVTLDAKLPDMTGLEVLRRIRRQNPEIRVVMCSVATTRGSRTTLNALMAGASHCVAKPELSASEYAYASFAETMLRKVCLHRTMRHSLESRPVKESKESRNSYFGAENRRRTQVLAIGGSAGGPAALAEILPLIPPSFSMPVLIAQQGPPGATRQLAERLSRLSRIEVVEGRDGMEVRSGIAYLAPAEHHMRVVRRLDRVEIALSQEHRENVCQPSIDVLFRSVAEAYGRSAVAAVLTGAGDDGLRGAGVLKALGSPIVVQDQASSAVWEMPKAIVDAGLADAVLPLLEIVPAILRYVVTGQEKMLPEQAKSEARPEMPDEDYLLFPETV